MVEKVFFALGGGGTDKKVDYPYVLISAATLWNGKKFKRFQPHENAEEIFLDSGGFSFFYRSGEYEFSPAEYISLAHKLDPAYVAIMDYPCEPDVVRTKYKTNYERIDRTIENAITLMDLDNGLNWIMVVQGHTPEEYLYCIDRIKEQWLVTKLMAIGSLCVRKQIKEAKEVILPIHKEVPAWIKLHGFGIDLKFLKDLAIFKALWSSDTSAWKWNNRAHHTKDWQPKGWMPKCEFDKLENLKHYKRKIKRIIELYSQQTTLLQHIS